MPPVKDPLISRFAEACGATGPLDLRVDLAEGGVLAEGTIQMPFSLVGRDDACDVTLTDAEVNPRHTWLQVIGGRIFALDLGSRTGLGWPGGGTGSNWLDVGVPVRVGPFQLQLRSPVSSRTAPFPLAYNPLHADTNLPKSHPVVTLEFRNGKRVKDRWTVNRLLTPIGRSPESKIRLTADDIAGYHCGLVLTPDGMWVVDLSGRGVVVNGERMRVSPLRHGAELWVGRFLIGIHYPASGTTPATGRPGALTPPNPLTGITLANALKSSPAAKPAAEDEVELGTVPTESGCGLPNSHIMADAFRFWSAAGAVSGPVSHPILVSGTDPIPPITSTPPLSQNPRTAPSIVPLGDWFASTPDPANAVAQLLRELGELHGQMFNQFQKSMVLMVQLFGCLRKDQMPAMQREMDRIQELNAELARLQSEVARRAVEVSGPLTPPRTPAPRISSHTSLPMSDTALLRTPTPDSTALHHWVLDRINSLQEERKTRWQSLVGMFAEKNAG
jgi:pSer/pThr/pTyr-binding forkhead associated (FHA) protein